MTAATQRVVFRWIHIAVGLPIVGYVYSPFEALPDFAAPTRYVFMPVLLLTTTNSSSPTLKCTKRFPSLKETS